MAAKAVATKTTTSKSFIDFKSVIFWVLAIVFFCYANSLTNGYNMDDEIVTINHPLTSKGLSAIPDILKSPYFKSDIYSYEYRPIVHISFAIEHQFLGESPFVSHLINLLLYLLLIYVAFDLLKRLFPAVNQTIIAAIVLVFALHPTHTEVVASIKNRDEILALLFSLLAWREAIKFVTTKQWWRVLLVVLLFNLAMGSKVTVIPMVFIIPLSVWLLLDTINIKVILLSLLLSVNGVIWFQQLYFKTQLGSVVIILSFFSMILVIKNLNAIRELFKIKDVVSDSQRFNFTIKNSELFTWIKANGIILFLQLCLNVILVLHGAPFYGMIMLVFIPILLSFLSDKKTGGLWFILSAIITLELAFLFSQNEIAEIFLIYSYITFGYFLSKKYLPYYIFVFIILISFLISLKTIYATTLILILNFVTVRRFPLRYLFLAACFFSLLSSLHEFDGRKIDLLAVIMLFFLLLIYNLKAHISTIKINTNYLIASYFVLCILGFSILSNYGFKSTIDKTITSYSISPEINGKNIIPTQTYRPVLHAEFPVDLWKDPWDVKLGTSVEVLLKYLKIILVPYPLSFYYGYAEVKPVSVKSTWAIVSISIHLLLLIAAALSFKRNKLIAFGIALYLISIAPFSAFVAPIPGVMADRYLFAPTLGFAMVLVGIVMWLSKTDLLSKLSGITAFPKKARYVLSAVLLVYATLTIARNNDWKDRLTLFRNDIVNVPNSAQAHNLLAYHLNRTAQEVPDPFERKKLMEEAVTHFQRATEIWPEFMNASYDLGRTHEQLGNWNQAIAAYKRTFEIDTSFSDAIFRMGVIYETENKLDSAIIAYQLVTEDNPVNITAFNNLSYCYFKKQEYRNAIETGRRSSYYHPTNTDPFVNIGKTFLHIKENDSALYYFEKVYPNRADDRGLTEVLYKLWNEKGNTERTAFYYRRMQIMGMVK